MNSKVVLLVGVSLILLSFLWGLLVPKSWFWDDARATELNNLSVSLHESMHAHDEAHDHEGHDHHEDHFGEDHAEESPAVQAAAKKYQAAQAELEAAKLWTDAMPAYLRWTGLSLCLAGLALHVVVGNEAQQ